ncbi:MAG: cadmium-translocating P-type ATPase [Chloroflexi bacterium]|nr:cadmium-translocating P-type ATPase [Chloroflexota bacterium]
MAAYSKANITRISTLRISGMDCPDCALTIERKVGSLDGVKSAKLNFATSMLTVELAPTVPIDKLVRAVDEAGYEAEPDFVQPTKPWWQRIRRHDLATAASGMLLAIGFLLSITGQPTLAVSIAYALAILVGGYYTARRGIVAARSLNADINLLMTIAVLGAVAIGEWIEGATVVFLFSLANTLESYTLGKTRNAIRELMELAPKEATIRHNGHLERVSVSRVKVGDVVVARPGEKIPMDGTVVGGASAVDQAAITGESIPVFKTVGDEVYAGTINQRGALDIRVTRPFEDNTISKIIHLVEEAQSKRAPSQQFIDRFARYYTPGVIGLAVGVAIIPPLLLGLPFGPWIYRALALLVVSCPCALVISTPVTIVSAITNASRNGVLIKGGAYLEQTGALSVVAFDKTGTLTNGRPEVVEVVPLNGHSERDILAVSASVEHHSEHPLAEAILRKARRAGLQLEPVSNFESITGMGVKAALNGTTYYVGSARLFEELGLSVGRAAETLDTMQQRGETAMLVGTGQELIGVVAVADQLRDSSRKAIEKQHRSGIKRVIMLTGDNEVTARAIANQLGIDEFRAGLMPEGKVEAMKELIGRYGKVAMIGDGVNDAPALATATVGAAMGTAGSDAALETADIALMADDLSKVPYVIDLSRRTLAIIKQNIIFALLVKTVFLGLVFPGWLTLWLAVVGDMGTSLIVIANGMRLARTKR